MKVYYYSDGKEKFGPFKLEELKNHKIYENTLIWYKGLEKWRYAKNIPELTSVISKKNVINVDEQINVFESQDASNKHKDEGGLNKSNLVNYRIVGVLAILLISFLLIKYWDLAFLEDDKDAVETNRLNNQVVFDESFHMDAVKNLIKAEDKRDIDKVYSFYSKSMKRYWDLFFPDSIALKNKYNYTWSLSSNSNNRIDTVIKVTKNNYDLYTNFNHYSLKKKAYLSNKSRIRFVFDDNGKIDETYSLKISDEQYDFIAFGNSKEGDKIIEKTIYFDEDWNITTNEEYAYYRIISINPQEGLVENVTDFYKTNEIQWQGQLLKIKGFDSNEDQLNGWCTWYYKNGNKSSVSYYSEGVLDGLSTDYDENEVVTWKGRFSKGNLIETLYPKTKPLKKELKTELSSDLAISNQFNAVVRDEGKLRNGPSPISEIIKVIPKNMEVTILNYDDGYWKVKYFSQVGYLSEIYLYENYKMKELKDLIKN